MRRKTRKPKRKKRANPFRLFDILGVALIFLCPITLIALAAGESSGILGRYIAAFLRVSVGIGAYVIPFMLALLGVLFIVGPLQIIPRNICVGSSLMFLVVITWASLTAAIEGVKNPILGGGYVGDALAYTLRKATGDKIGYVVLTGLAVIATIVITDVPLASVIEKLRAAWLDWRDASRERRELASAMRAKTVVARSNPQPVRSQESNRKKIFANIFHREGSSDEETVSPAEKKPDVKVISLKPIKATQQSFTEDEQPAGEPGEFVLPPTTLLSEPQPPPPRVESELRENIEIIERTLAEFKVEANVVEIAHGPTVARYEIRLAPGIKVNKIVGLANAACRY